MKLTKRQQDDLETIMYFAPASLNGHKITEEDIKAFFKMSEKGVHPKEETNGFKRLMEGKRWRGIHVHEIYEPGISDGSVPYYTLLGGGGRPLPAIVVEFLKKEMFKGKDRDLIETLYTEILREFVVYAQVPKVRRNFHNPKSGGIRRTGSMTPGNLFLRDVPVGSTFYIVVDDGSRSMTVDKLDGDYVHCTSELGNTVPISSDTPVMAVTGGYCVDPKRFR